MKQVSGDPWDTVSERIHKDDEMHGTVTNLTDFGAFVEVLPGKDGLLHVSRISNKRVEKVTDVLNLGDTVTVKCYEIDDKGRVNLTRKGLEDTPIIKA